MQRATKPEPGTELLIINPQELTVDMPALLEKMDASIAKAQELFKLLPKIVDEETKQIHFKYKERLQLVLAQDKEERMPFTRKLNEIVKMFTSREAERERLIALVDERTAAWAKAELEKARAAQAKADADLAAAQAKINLEGRIRETCRQRLNAMLDNIRTAAGSLVNNVTKENLEKTKKSLNKTPLWKDEMTAFMVERPTWITDEKHFVSIVNEELETIKADYLVQSKEILDKSLTILDTALNNKEEAQRLQEAEDLRQKEADARRASEDQKAIDAQNAIAQMDVAQVEMPKVGIKMKIDVLSNDAWLHMISWWYKHDPEAKSKDLSKKTFAQCKTFCENWAYKTGEMIIHESLTYYEDVKAR